MRFYSYSIILLGLIFFSCSHTRNSSDSQVHDKIVHMDSLDDHRTDIDKALSALTEIQVNGDGYMMLYLTFPNIYHAECTGTVSTFKISKAAFRDALLEVMRKNNSRLTELQQTSLATIASKPLNSYTLTACGSTRKSMELTEGAIPPRKGTWIFSAIFGVSDLLINW